MSTFKNIPISVEPPPRADATAIARSVLEHLQVLLGELVRSGTSGSIDLRLVPDMGPDVYQLLKAMLCTGEVSATIRAAGQTEVQETAYPGIWWVTHRNPKNQVVSELIEVAEIPEILKSQPDDIRRGLRRLSKQLAPTESASTASSHSSGAN